VFEHTIHKFYKLRLCSNDMTNPEDVRIVPLTKELALDRLEDILALEDNWTEIGDEPWNSDNLMYELPEKWELSYIAMGGEEIIGYQIGSLRDEVVYLHKIVIDQKKRVKGAGRKLLKAFLEKSLKKGIERVRFKVRTDNPAVGFYEKLDFIPEKEIDYSRSDGVGSYFYNTLIKNVIENV